MEEFCHSHELSFDEAERQNRCSYRMVIKNFYNRIFNYIAAYQRVAETLSYFEWIDPNEVYLQSLKVGWEAGKAIRILFEFELVPDVFVQ